MAKCQAFGCNWPATRGGYCPSCYDDLTKVRCSTPGCDEEAVYGNLCTSCWCEKTAARYQVRR